MAAKLYDFAAEKRKRMERIADRTVTANITELYTDHLPAEVLRSLDELRESVTSCGELSWPPFGVAPHDNS